MNFNHLEYAVAVEKAGSIRKASQNLYLSQPYLSGMLKGLEEEVGYRIFNRTAAGITLTREGEEFIKSAQIILLELKRMREINVDKEERELNISCYYAAYVMEKFLKFHNASAYKFSDKIKEMGNEEVLEAVASGSSAIGIIFYANEKQRKYEKLIEKYDLYFEELIKPMEVCAFLYKTHPLAELDEIKVENLTDYPYVSYNDASARNYLDILGIREHPQILEVSDRGSFYDALRSGEYLSVMAYRQYLKDSDFITIPFQDRKWFLRSFYVIAKNYKLSKREQEFLMFMKE